MSTVKNKKIRYSNDAAKKLITSTANTSASQIPLEEKKLSFVLNIPLPANEEAIATIKSVLTAYQSIKEGITPPFAIIFFVNAKHPKQPKKSGKGLTSPIPATAIEEFVEALQDSEKIKELAESKIPIRIISGEWTGSKFPYGTIRNTIMHGKSTKEFVEAYQNQGYHPYIAVADADDGKRFTKDGIHIFEAIQNRLEMSNSFEAEMGIIDAENSIIEKAMHLIETAENTSAWFTLMEEQNSETWQNFLKQTTLSGKDAIEKYQEAWIEYLIQQNEAINESPQALVSKTIYAHPYLIAGGYRTKADLSPNDKSIEAQQAKRRAEIIQEDMNARTFLSKVNPLGPYFPEPNLYIDASIAQEVNFGPNGAESDHLKVEVEKVIKQEVLKKAKEIYKPTHDKTIVPKPKPLTKDEIEQNRLALMSNNRDPDRHILVAPMFDLTIETDTDRLFKKVDTNEKLFGSTVYNSVAQHHRSSNAAKTTYLGTRYNGDIEAEEANFGSKRKELERLEKRNPLDLFAEITKTELGLLKKNTQSETRKRAKTVGEGKRKASSFIDESHLFLDVFNTALASQSAEFQSKFVAGREIYMEKVIELRDILERENKEKPALNPELLTARIFKILEDEVLAGESLSNPNKKLKTTSSKNERAIDVSERLERESENTSLKTLEKGQAQSTESFNRTKNDFFKRQSSTLAQLSTKGNEVHKAPLNKRKNFNTVNEQTPKQDQSTSSNNFTFNPFGKKGQ